MSQGSKTFCDICRHLAGKGGILPVAIRDSQLKFRTGTANSEQQSYVFLVAAMADGDVSLMVLPSTLPAYLVVPAVKVISAPVRRP